MFKTQSSTSISKKLGNDKEFLYGNITKTEMTNKNYNQKILLLPREIEQRTKRNNGGTTQMISNKSPRKDA